MERSDLIARLRNLPAGQRVITALDVPTGRDAVNLAASLGKGEHIVKVGLELFSAAGPDIVDRLIGMHRRIFLDLKYHDIPNTVASAARVAAELGVTMCTVHAAAGRGALTAAAEALARCEARPALLAVTVLTSMSEQELAETCPSTGAIADRIDRLARLAWDCGCDGLVCAATDLPRLRAAVGPDPLVVTPGIRPAGTAADDQHRIATPAAAIAAGADFLVIGRPITRADDPAAALASIVAELQAPGGTT